MRWKNDNMNSENIGRVLGIEVACRWGNEASSFIRMLPKESQIQPFFALSSHHATSALMSRWPAPITHAAAISFVAPSLVEPHKLDVRTVEEVLELPLLLPKTYVDLDQFKKQSVPGG